MKLKTKILAISMTVAGLCLYSIYELCRGHRDTATIALSIAALFIFIGAIIVIAYVAFYQPDQQQPAPEPVPDCKPKKIYLMQIGGFIDEMRAVAGKYKHAWDFFNKWHDSISPDSWTRTREMQLDEKWTQYFVDDMTDLFQGAIGTTTDGDLNKELSSDGHQFMQAVKDRCVALGLNVGDIDFNPSLSFGDAVARAQG